jgi:hypothetical protein
MVGYREGNALGSEEGEVLGIGLLQVMRGGKEMSKSVLYKS